MTCKNCEPWFRRSPGSFVKVTAADWTCCAECGQYLIREKVDDSKWDTYFHSICVTVSTKSPCLSRKIGAVIVKDHSIVSTGYNGPPRGIPHCGQDRFLSDTTVSKQFDDILLLPNIRRRIDFECPRRVLGYESGTHMELCPAQHAEENAISNAARLGVSVLGSTLYMNSVIPCSKCFGTLINAGITEVVIEEVKAYDKHTQYLIDNSSIVIRSFENKTN
uniref:Putative CMP/dCMP deaminase zinc-binding n=1 Tax=viral metagenome TaxID=1070528 RepID=A0A6M3JMA3_9ZZZZ